MSTPNCTTPPHVPGTESCGGVLLLMTIPAVGTVALGAGRADAVRPAADGHVLNGAKRLLLGIDGLSFPDVPLFQLPAHDPRQRINPGLVDIRHPGRGKALHGVSVISSSVLDNGFSILILRYS